MTEAHIQIRRAILSDGNHLPELYEAAIRLIGSKFYTAEQVEAWASRSPFIRKVFIDTFADRQHWVAVNEASGDIQGFIDLSIDPEGDGHIDFFYACPEITRSDVTSQLYEALLRFAKESNCPRLYTEASEAARRFFEKRGFKMTTRNDLIIGDVAIHNFSMEKLI